MAIFSILALKNRITERIHGNRSRSITGVDLQEILHDVIDSLVGTSGVIDPGTLNPEKRFSEYGLSLAPDGIRLDFSTAHEYVLLSTRVYLNGIRQFLGDDYTESGNGVLHFNLAPFQDDKIIVDYYFLIT